MIGCPTKSLMLLLSVRPVWFHWNRRGAPQNLVHYQFSGGQRGGDAQALMTGGEVEARTRRARADERKFVGRGGAEAGPAADGGDLRERRHVFLRALQHARQHVGVDGGILHAILTR